MSQPHFVDDHTNQPEALVRSDDDGMYVAVGGTNSSAFSGGGVSPVAGPGSRTPSPDGRRLNLDESGSSGTRGADAVRDGRGTFGSQAVMSSGVRTLSTPRSGPGGGSSFAHHYHGTGSAGGGFDDSDQPSWAVPGITSRKQPWLSGWTYGCCNHPASACDACCCPWCVHGMQWKRLHETEEQRRERVRHLRAVMMTKHGAGGGGSPYVAGHNSSTSGGGKRHIDSQAVEEAIEAHRKEREALRQQKREAEDNARSPSSRGQDEDDDGAGAQDAAQRRQKQQEEEAAKAAAKRKPPYYQNDSAYESYYENVNCCERCSDRCGQIDWCCCLATFCLDLIFTPLMLTPFGSATAQYHIRQAARKRYNLVPAPGSMTEEEEVERLDNARLISFRLQQKRQAHAVRQETRRKFGDNFPEAAQRGASAQGEQDEIDNAEYQAEERKLEAELEAVRNHGNKKGGGACSDDCKEIMYSWCCCCCSAAQVQREMLLRQDYPDGFFAKPLRARRSNLAIAPQDADAMLMRSLEAMNTHPAAAAGGAAGGEQREAWMDEVTWGRRGSPPPSRHLQEPPPSTHGDRHQGVRAADVAHLRGSGWTSPPGPRPTSRADDDDDNDYDEPAPRSSGSGLPSSRQRPLGNSVLDMAGRH